MEGERIFSCNMRRKTHCESQIGVFSGVGFEHVCRLQEKSKMD